MESTQSSLRHRLSNSSFNFSSRFRREQPTPRSYPNATMNPNEMLKNPDSSGMGMWSSPPAAPATRPRPVTIHETGFTFCMPEEYPGLPSWDSSTLPMNPHESIQQNYSVPQNFYSSPAAGNNDWNSKNCDGDMEMEGLEGDVPIGQAYTTDEAVPILDLRYPNSEVNSEQLTIDTYNSRRMSGSSFTLSTTGGLSEMPSYEDFSTALSDAPSFNSDYPPTSNRNSLMSSTQLSPVASPRMTPQNRSELVRTQSRGRASPSPRPNVRSAPYSVEAARNKRWSTGSYAPSRRPSPFVYHAHDTFSPFQRMASRHSSPTMPQPHVPLNMTNLNSLQTQQHPFFMPNQPFQRNSMFLPSSNFQEPPALESQPAYLSHGLFRMLQSNADPHALHSHYTDLSDPPDLYASLQEEQIPPPEEDMNPEDPDMVPHEQELRFEGDLYTPRWVRGHGNKREGWCGICKPGRWLVLKNSAFWYDKSFTHGISAATGCPFQEPQETRRMDGNPDVWEGLCASCNEWVALVSSKKKGTTWFRHAYKCHTHPKVKDAPKRRRESSHNRATLAASTMASQSSQVKPKTEDPTTPQMVKSEPVSSLTPTPSNHVSQQHLHPHPQVQVINNPLEGLTNMI